jgi:regulator of sigma D
LQNFVSIQNSFHEICSLLFSLVLANPTLLDARLSQIENQLQDRLRRVTHAIQSAVHQRFAVDYLNLAEMAELFRKLEERALEAGCELLVQYHSDLFQIETSLPGQTSAHSCPHDP